MCLDSKKTFLRLYCVTFPSEHHKLARLHIVAVRILIVLGCSCFARIPPRRVATQGLFGEGLVSS